MRSKTSIILFALWLLMFSSSSQFLIIAPILPVIGQELNIPAPLQGTLITGYALSLGLFALLIGPISDKFGRRQILLWGTGAMCASLSLHWLAYDFTSILILRTITGMSGGILTGACVSYIGDYFPSDKRGWANGIVATGGALGQILGIPIGTVLAGKFGFATPFLLFALTMFVAFLMVWRSVPQPTVKFSQNKLTAHGILKDYGHLIKQPATIVTAASYFLVFLSLTVYVVYFPTWLQIEFGVTDYEIASLFLVGGLATVIAGPLAGRISDIKGRKRVIILASIPLALIMLLIAIVPHRFVLIYGMFFLLMLLIAARMIPFQAMASEMIDGRLRGKLMCLTIAIGQLGMGLGAALSGPLYTSYGFIGNALVGALAVMINGILVWKLLVEPGAIATITFEAETQIMIPATKD